MDELRKAAQMALEALESDPDAMVEVTENHWHYTRDLALDALRAALAQPEQEPVAWMQKEDFIDSEGLWDERKTVNCEGDGTPLYTHPPQRKPLTVDQIYEVLGYGARAQYSSLPQYAIECVRAIEKAHGIGP